MATTTEDGEEGVEGNGLADSGPRFQVPSTSETGRPQRYKKYQFTSDFQTLNASVYSFSGSKLPNKEVLVRDRFKCPELPTPHVECGAWQAMRHSPFCSTLTARATTKGVLSLKTTETTPGGCEIGEIVGRRSRVIAVNEVRRERGI